MPNESKSDKNRLLPGEFIHKSQKEKNSAEERINAAITTAVNLVAEAGDSYKLTKALYEAGRLTGKIMVSDDFMSEGTEIASKILELVHNWANKLQFDLSRISLAQDYRYRIIMLATVFKKHKARRAGRNYPDSYFEDLMLKYLKDTSLADDAEKEHRLVTGQELNFKKKFDGGKLDWCWDQMTDRILCRSSCSEDWRKPVKTEEKDLLESGELDHFFTPIVTLKKGLYLTFDGRLMGTGR